MIALSNIKSNDWLFLRRVVRFGDTDAAGVIHYHNLFRWSHESWEESLDKYGLQAIDIFPSSMVDQESFIPIALPIIHCEADFFSPIRIGDQLDIEIIPSKLDTTRFEIKYIFYRENNNVAISLLRHRSISAKTRFPCNLPEGISRWLEESTLNRGIAPL